MEAYFRDLLAERRLKPADDLLSELLAVEDGGDGLTTDELISTAILLFGAGFETTTNLIGNGLLALLRHRPELERVRNDRGLLRSAVEELLRYDSPVQLDVRKVLDDVVIGADALKAGTFVVTLIGACNRDPSRFPDPDRLDLGRADGPPLSFGSGIHYCLGAALARVEGQVVFDRLVERFPGMELATDVVDYRSSLTLRGLVELPVALGG
jgi:cytochrome P450